MELGIKNDLPRQEIKNVRLLNFCCTVWILLNIVLIIEDIIVHYPKLTHSLVYLSTILFLIVVVFFQIRSYYTIARVIFILLSVVYYMLFAIYLEPGAFLEFLLLLIPIYSLIFFNNQWISVFVLILTYTLFMCTMTFSGNYLGHRVLYIGNLGLFVGVYVAFAYFKELNMKREKSLEKRHNQAIIHKEKIEQQRKELEELNRFQSYFWVNLSHEIRTPLTLIKGSSTKLSKEKNPEKLANYYKRIEQNSDKIHLLIDNIMDLAKMKSNKLEISCNSVSIIQFCKKALNSFEPLFSQKQIEYYFINQIKTQDIMCNIDPVFMERALGNLLSNACKYTDEKGKVELILKLNKDQVCIHVKDTGRGIPEEELPYIFNSFYRAKNSTNHSGGTGIGLSFTKEVIDIHKGRIKVKSTENQGSEFIIYLPVDEIGSLGEKENSLAPLPIDKNIDKNSRILLIEDNIEMRTYIKDILSDYHITEAGEGNEALAMLSKPYPDLIITDYMMPGMNGYKFVHSIREKGLDIPVIVITARVDREAKIDFLRLGLDDYLNKPFNEEELLLRVAHSLKNNKERIQFNESIITNITESKELDKLREIIEKNIKSSLFGVKELADILFVSERTLQRKIKSLCGLTPIDFIREVKLQKAIEYYENKKINSTKELASEVGYTNSGHLAILFEKRFGIKLDFRSRL